MRRLAHVLGRLRLTVGACLLVAAALATGLTLLASSGGGHSRNDSTRHSTALAGSVRVDAAVRPPAESASRSRQAEPATERSTVTRPQPGDEPRSSGGSHLSSGPAGRSVASRGAAPRAGSSPMAPQPSLTVIGGPSRGNIPQRGASDSGSRRGKALTGLHPSLVRTPPASVQDGQPWKPAGSPAPIPQIPSNSSASELTFYCFIAHAVPAGTCPPATDPATHVSVSLAPTQTLANGGSSTVTANVTDNSGAPEESETFTFSANGAAGVTIGATTNNGNGTYSATITTNSAATGLVTITANDSTASLNGSAQLSLTSSAVGPAAHVSVAVNPGSIQAGATPGATVTATVTDANGQPVVNDGNIVFSASPNSGVTLGSTTSNNNAYSATITSTTAGQLTITAMDSVTGATGSTTLTVNPGSPAGVSVSVNPAQIRANGTDTTTATATVTDANNNPVPNQTVNFSANRSDITIGSGSTCTTASTGPGIGTCQVTITGGTTVESVTITATDPAISNAPGQAPLSVTPLVGPAANISLALTNKSGTQITQAPADGTTTLTLTATVVDGSTPPQPVSTDVVTVSASGGISASPVVMTPIGSGRYQTTITTSTQPGLQTIVVTDDSGPKDSKGNPTVFTSVSLTLTSTGQVQAGAASVAVSISPVAIVADGVSHAIATAQVDAADGTPVSNDAVQFFVNGQPFGSICTTDSTGQCHVTLSSSTVVGSETITAVDNSAGFLPSGNSVVLSFVPPQPGGTGTGPGTTSTPTTAKPAHHASGPSLSKIKASLAELLGADGASIKALLKQGSHGFSYRALAAGKLRLGWWDGPSATKPKLIASVTVTISKAKKVTARLRLTGTGRTALLHAKSHLKVKSAVSFKASGKPAVSRSSTFTLH